jgi:hypothetical protein
VRVDDTVISKGSTLDISAKYVRASFVLIASIAALVYALLIYSTRFEVGHETYFTLVDDAMISMRYAMHLAAGHGLVWNIGEEPVEGFTNLSWTLYMSVVHLFPFPESKISLVIMLTSAATLLVNLYFIKKIADRVVNNSPFVSIVAVGVTAFYFPLLFWSLRGMEIGLLALLTSAGTLLTFKLAESPTKRDTILLSSVIAAMLLTRPEALISVLLFIAYIAIHSFKRRGRFETYAIVVTAGVTMVLLELFRLSYFGELIPNTAFLKMTGVTVGERLSVGVNVFIENAVPDLWLPVLLIVTGAILTPSLFNRRVLFLIGMVAIAATYSVYVGGDYAEAQVGGSNRYITLGAPYLFIAMAVAVYGIIKPILKSQSSLGVVVKASYVSIMVVVVTLSLNDSVGRLRDWRSGEIPMLADDVWRAERGVLIQVSTEPDAVIAVHAAGQMSYYSHRTAVDLLGKSDPIIAKQPQVTEFRPGHNKWNYGYGIVNKRPDLIADEWGDSPVFLEESTNAYIRLANGVWVDRASSKVDHLVVSGYLPPWSETTAPEELPELNLWLDAQQLVGLQDGDLVEKWADSTGKGHDAFQPELALRPTFRTSRGIPMVSFDGVDDFLRVQDHSDIRFDRSDFTIALVFVRNDNSKTNLRLMSKGAMNDEQPGYGTDGGDSGQTFRLGDGDGRTSVSARHSGVQQISVMLFEVDRDGEAFVWQPGVRKASVDASRLGSIANTIDLHIGSSPSPSLYWDGDIAEVIFYSRALDSEDLEALGRHLVKKWLSPGRNLR